MRKPPFALFILLAAIMEWTSFSEGSDTRFSSIKSDERVVFFDTAAWLDESRGRWIVPVHGWIHEPGDSLVRKAAIAAALEKKYGLRATRETRGNFNCRINLFLVDNERGKRLGIRLARAEHGLPPSGPNGHFQGTLELAVADVDEIARQGRMRYSAALPAKDRRSFSGLVHLIPPTGLSVISDIDDTIKLTHVTDRKKMIDQTFFQEFQPAPGMAELYTDWARRGVRFHFVSSSPWQLYEPLKEFTARAGFPEATFHLKSVRLTDRTFFNLFKKGTETKPAQIEPLLRAYPKRRFILVGDSGEQDPEVYAGILRKHPRQIERIYIRNVTGVSAEDPRFQTTFAGLDRRRWRLFTDPSTLELPE